MKDIRLNLLDMNDKIPEDYFTREDFGFGKLNENYKRIYPFERVATFYLYLRSFNKNIIPARMIQLINKTGISKPMIKDTLNILQSCQLITWRKKKHLIEIVLLPQEQHFGGNAILSGRYFYNCPPLFKTTGGDKLNHIEKFLFFLLANVATQNSLEGFLTFRYNETPSINRIVSLQKLDDYLKKFHEKNYVESFKHQVPEGVRKIQVKNWEYWLDHQAEKASDGKLAEERLADAMRDLNLSPQVLADARHEKVKEIIKSMEQTHEFLKDTYHKTWGTQYKLEVIERLHKEGLIIYFPKASKVYLEWEAWRKKQEKLGIQFIEDVETAFNEATKKPDDSMDLKSMVNFLLYYFNSNDSMTTQQKIDYVNSIKDGTLKKVDFNMTPLLMDTPVYNAYKTNQKGGRKPRAKAQVYQSTDINDIIASTIPKKDEK